MGNDSIALTQTSWLHVRKVEASSAMCAACGGAHCRIQDVGSFFVLVAGVCVMSTTYIYIYILYESM